MVMISREQWLKSLHAKGTADTRLAEQMDEAERLLKAAARPKQVYKIIQRDELNTQGDSIEKHLEGCHKAVLMAVTLGTDVDLLIRKTQVTDMAKAVIIDAGASVMVEQLADEFEDNIKQRLPEDEYMTCRFSPGYGDWPITEQKNIVRKLDAQRQIGLNITADSLMVPRKSITAVMGISDHPVSGRPAACSECVLRGKCELRKEGKFCGDRF